MSRIIAVFAIACSLSMPLFAACPSADLNRDCFVDFSDLAIMLSQWLTTDPCVPQTMAHIRGGIFQMGDSKAEGASAELPVHTVTLSSFFMSKYAVTNAQYCEFLNSAMSQNLISIIDGAVYKAGTSFFYCDTSSIPASMSQIAYNGGVFSVRTKNGRSMENDPIIEVSWYGAAAYCNWLSCQQAREQCYDMSTWACNFLKNGYHLPSEAQWEYAARGGLAGKRFGWGDTITHSQANYYSDSSLAYDISSTRGFHPNWNDGIFPYTCPVGSFAANGYGLYDMAGNMDWCNDWYGNYNLGPQTNPTGPISGNFRIIRGGNWNGYASLCRAAGRNGYGPNYGGHYHGFRVCMNIN